MKTEYEEVKKELTAYLEGEIDHHSAVDIRSEIDMKIEKYVPKKLILDYGEVIFMDSSGIAVLLRQQGEMQLLQGFEALSEALFWLEGAVENSLRTLCIGVEPPD